MDGQVGRMPNRWRMSRLSHLPECPLARRAPGYTHLGFPDPRRSGSPGIPGG
jgi:hypothetical protein